MAALLPEDLHYIVTRVLTDLLREVDPLTVVDGLEVAEVHEVEREQDTEAASQ